MIEPRDQIERVTGWDTRGADLQRATYASIRELVKADVTVEFSPGPDGESVVIRLGHPNLRPAFHTSLHPGPSGIIDAARDWLKAITEPGTVGL